MVPISIIIITLNEEKKIRKCIESVINISDDIIVIDSNSQDRTTDICNEYDNVKVIINKFTNYSQQRNFGTLHAKYDYVLNIDADEYLSEELQNSILSQKYNAEKNYSFSFNRQNFYCNKPIKHGGWYPDIKQKFWNKKFAEWEGDVHETLKFVEKPVDIRLKGDLMHYTFDSIGEHIGQINKFTEISAKQLFRKNKKPGIKLILSPPIKFIKDYFFKLGFLDGFYGFVIAKNNAYAKFAKYSKLKQLYYEK